MQKTLLASVIVVALSACNGGDGVNLVPDGSEVDNGTSSGEVDQGTQGSDDGGVVVEPESGTDTNGGNSGDQAGGDTTGDNSNSGGTGGTAGGDSSSTDDSNSNTGDSSGNGTSTDGGGATTGDDIKDDDKGDDADTDADDPDVKPDMPIVNDDSGSATSDGGEVTDDSGSATSDGGAVTDDSGSATSDGGVSDDSGSSTSDGGSNDDSGSSTSDGGNTGGNFGTVDGGSFESDQIGGTVIRTSSLSSTGQANVCTTANAQNNFSDTRVGDFILHNNAWRTWRAAPGYDWEQCIYTNTNGALAGWSYDWGPGQTGINGNPNASGDFYVRSYPELIYGVKDEYRTSAPKSVTGLPVRLGDMPNISIDYAYDGPQYGESRTVNASNNANFPNGTTISGERNVAIESFLYNADANGQCTDGIVTRNGGSNHVYEIMVWLDAGAERLPAGPTDFVTNVSIRGEAFKVYTKGADPRYVAFVAQNPRSSGTLYWNDFTDWSKTYAHRVEQEFGARNNSNQIQDDWCVANIIVGTEIFWGAGNLNISNWTITQKQP